MAKIAFSSKANEEYLLVETDTARQIAFDLHSAVCALLQEREIKRLTSDLSEEQDK